MTPFNRSHRRFGRVDIPYGGGLTATTPAGAWLGAVRTLSGGGLLLQSQQDFKQGQQYRLRLVDEAAGMGIEIEAVAIYSLATGTGFEFKDLEPGAADAIASLIVKYRAKAALNH